MTNILLWIVFGAMSGWIGYLATRNSESGHLRIFLTVGSIGGLIGGFLARSLGLTSNPGSINTETLFSALMISAVFVTALAVFSNFFGKTSSS